MDDAILRREPLTQANLDMLFRVVRPVEATVLRLGDADLSRGTGILSDNRKCIWTTDGHRITFTTLRGGGFLAGLSKEPDPLADAAPTTTNQTGGE